MPSVLLVDPEPGVIVTLKMILERDGYSVSTATSYVEATALLQNESWDILITELDLEAEALGLRLRALALALAPLDDVAADVPGRQTERTTQADQQVGEILADTHPPPQHLVEELHGPL